MTVDLTSHSEEAALFNPAFVGLLLAASAREYAIASGDRMPFSIAFVLIPMALHAGTRAALPGRANAHISKWVLDNPVLQADLPERASLLRETVRAGLRYAVRSGSIEITGWELRSRIGRVQLPTRDANECLSSARLLARWFSRSGGAEDIYLTLGVRP